MIEMHPNGQAVVIKPPAGADIRPPGNQGDDDDER